MSRKSPKIASLIADLKLVRSDGECPYFDPHYTGYFECFNRQMYYEAHDVLEELWLHTRGKDHLFYKGLIQLAGAFVHLKKSRLDPGARLFRLALKNVAPYGPSHEGLDVKTLMGQIHQWLTQLEDSNYAQSPYDPNQPPKLELEKPRE